MSLRVTKEEEEEEGGRNSSTSSGLGTAAAVIGIGVSVGAALYYFFSQRPEHPHSAGSTSRNQHEKTFFMDSFRYCDCSDSDDCVTISEHTTTDTSMVTTDSDASDRSDSDQDSDIDASDVETSDSYHSAPSESGSNYESSDAYSDDETGYLTFENVNDSDSDDWEVMSSDDVPHVASNSRICPLAILTSFVRPRHRTRNSRQESKRNLRQNQVL